MSYNSQYSSKVLVFIFFMGFAFQAWGADEIEPNNTVLQAQGNIPLNSSITGSLSLVTPLDLYDFFLIQIEEEGGLFQVGVVPTTELRVEVVLLDSDGHSVMASKVGDAAGSNAGVRYNNIRKGFYYVYVAAVSGAGTYTATFNFAPVEEVDIEDNDHPYRAQRITLNKETNGHIGHHGQRYSDFEDFFILTVPKDGSIDLTAYPDGDLNIRLILIDSNGSRILSNVDSQGKGLSEKIVYNNLAAGDYYIQIVWTEGYGSYNLTNLFTENLDANDVEPNDRSDQAQLVTMTPSGENYEANISGHLGYYGNLKLDIGDFYQITLATYGKLSLKNTQSAGGNLDIGYDLFSKDLRYLGGTSSDQWDVNDLPAGSYLLKIRHEGSHGTYNVQAVLEPQTPPEDYSGATSPLALHGGNVDVELSDAIASSYHLVQVPADGRFKLTIAFPSGLHGEASIFDRNGRTRLANSSSYYGDNVREIVIPFLLGGEYLVYLQRYGGSGVVNLKTEFTPTQSLDVEPNDEWTVSQTVQLDQTESDTKIIGHIGYSGNGYTDIIDSYFVDLESDGYFHIDITGESTLHYDIQLYSLRYGQITRITNVGSYYNDTLRTMGKNGILAGRYLLYLNRHGGYGNYEITLRYTVNRSSNPEPDENKVTITDIHPNEGIVGHLGFEQTNRLDYEDWYRLILPEDGSLSVYIQGEASLHYDLYLYHSDQRSRIVTAGSYYNPILRSLGHDRLKAGTYYLQAYRHGGQGTYHIITKYNPVAPNDTPGANVATMARDLALNEIAQGSLGFSTENTFDAVDWYRVQVPQEGKYRLYYQAENRLYAAVFLLRENLSQIIERGSYYNSQPQYWEGDLPAGTYYLKCLHRGNGGTYSIQLSDPQASTVGTVKGKVVTATNFPLFEVEITVLDRTYRSDFDGAFTVENLAPGTYPFTFKSGAKYYPVTAMATVESGQISELNVTLLDANLTAPADVDPLLGFVSDRYVHLYWMPSVSPDVDDGGGYKLYIDNQPAIDLKNVLSYRNDGFVNGQSYTFRLTVYDKHGNESQGAILVLTPTGEGVIPTPTPTVIQTPVDQPTATPTVTPTMTPTIQPSIETPIPTTEPTATSIPVLITPTPTPTNGSEMEPVIVYEFDHTTLAECGWSEIPGGFETNTPAGVVLPMPLQTGMIPSSIDQKGLTFVVKSNEVAFIYANEAVDTQGYPCLIRATVRANGPTGQVALVALKGSIATFADLDGSIATHIPHNSAGCVEETMQMILVYQPDTSNFLTPIIQVAGTGSNNPVTIYIDKLEVYRLDRGCVPVELFSNRIEP